MGSQMLVLRVTGQSGEVTDACLVRHRTSRFGYKCLSCASQDKQMISQMLVLCVTGQAGEEDKQMRSQMLVLCVTRQADDVRR